MQRGAKTSVQYTHVVGIDEAGRGPLAGPVAVCAAMSTSHVDIAAVFPGLADSKVMTTKARERVFELVQVSEIRYAVHFGSVADIETLGITKTVQKALDACIEELAPQNSFIYLDGLLKAPPQYQQETVIHGDALIPVISLASVIAKVSRDAHMRELDAQYPEYGFEKHKGYGTAEHISALKRLGPAPVHRRSFLSRILGSAVG